MPIRCLFVFPLLLLLLLLVLLPGFRFRIDVRAASGIILTIYVIHYITMHNTGTTAIRRTNIIPADHVAAKRQRTHRWRPSRTMITPSLVHMPTRAVYLPEPFPRTFPRRVPVPPSVAHCCRAHAGAVNICEPLRYRVTGPGREQISRTHIAHH